MSGKPRSGLVFDKRQSARIKYRKGIRDRQKLSTLSYTNDLHEALLKKNRKLLFGNDGMLTLSRGTVVQK